MYIPAEFIQQYYSDWWHITINIHYYYYETNWRNRSGGKNQKWTLSKLKLTLSLSKLAKLQTKLSQQFIKNI